MRRLMLLLSAMAFGVILASGVALAANVIACTGGYAKAPPATTR